MKTILLIGSLMGAGIASAQPGADDPLPLANDEVAASYERAMADVPGPATQFVRTDEDALVAHFTAAITDRPITSDEIAASFERMLIDRPAVSATRIVRTDEDPLVTQLSAALYR